MGQNYIDRIATLIAEECGDVEPIPEEDLRLYRIYAVLALVVSDSVTAKDVHDAWSAWRSSTNPDHQSIIPFDELSQSVQHMDDIYVDGIRSVVEKEGL